MGHDDEAGNRKSVISESKWTVGPSIAASNSGNEESLNVRSCNSH
jgi:hypothetical protein